MGTEPSSTRRNVDETIIGIYWGYDGAAGLGTPPRLYNQIIREVAQALGNTPAKNARLFALINLAMGDSGIHEVSMEPTGTGNNNINNDCHSIWLPFGAPKSNSATMEKTLPRPLRLTHPGMLTLVLPHFISPGFFMA